MYRYFCKECNKYFRRYEVPNRAICPECGGVMRSIRFSVQNDPFIGKKLGDKCGIDALHVENERWSAAMGCNPDEIPKFQKKWPWMEFHPKTGDCLVRNRHEKLRIMKARGFTERG